jgi:hydrogenase expression/formation protein HypC
MCLAIPGKVLEIQGDDPLMRTGRVQFGGFVKEVNPDYTPDVAIDQFALVHVGFAISVLDNDQTLRTAGTGRGTRGRRTRLTARSCSLS